MTMGTAWQYQPQNEHYKSGGELIRLLVQTRDAQTAREAEARKSHGVRSRSICPP